MKTIFALLAILCITFQATNAGVINSLIRDPRVDVSLPNRFQLTGPSGTYEGKKEVLGIAIDAKMTFDSDTQVDIDVQASDGSANIQCDNESYNESGGSINLPNAGNNGDCVHDGLQEYGLSLKSITYDASSDEITLNIKKLIINIAVTLTKNGEMRVVIEFPRIENIQGQSPIAATPSGTYSGTKTVIGITIQASITIDSTTTADINVSASDGTKISCKAERYQLSGSNVVLPDVNKAGDCVGSALKKNGLKLSSINYDSKADAIDLNIKKSIVKIQIVLTHQGSGILKKLFMDQRKQLAIENEIF